MTRRLRVTKMPGPRPWKLTTTSTLTGAVVVLASFPTWPSAWSAAYLATHPGTDRRAA